MIIDMCGVYATVQLEPSRGHATILSVGTLVWQGSLDHWTLKSLMVLALDVGY